MSVPTSNSTEIIKVEVNYDLQPAGEDRNTIEYLCSIGEKACKMGGQAATKACANGAGLGSFSDSIVEYCDPVTDKCADSSRKVAEQALNKSVDTSFSLYNYVVSWLN